MMRAIIRLLSRGILQGLQLIAVVAANNPRTVSRAYSQFTTWDLLKSQRMAARLRDGQRILDVGSGSGKRLHELGLFRRIERHGVDIHVRGNPPDVEMHVYDGHVLPFPDASFDVVVICYVMHHLTPQHAQKLFSEIVRVARDKVLVLEDSMPEWSLFYRLRNRFHRVEADLQYGAESEAYASPGSEAMFLTHDGWKRWFEQIPRVKSVEVEPLHEISKYAHHTLFDVGLSPPQ